MTESTVDRYTILPNGTKMPTIGLGTYNISNAPYSIEEALRIGYRMIDSAFCYPSEEEVGNALKNILNKENSPIKREDLFIISKLPNNGHRRVSYFIKKSLKAFHVNYLDLYLIHSPLAMKGEKDMDNFPIENGKIAVDNEVDLLDTWKYMEEAVDSGLVKNIGLSNFGLKQIDRIYENARIKPSNLQVECNPFLPQWELHEYCKKRNISFTAYAPLGAPFLPELSVKLSIQADPDFPTLLDYPVLLELGEKYNKTSAQIILRWLVQRGIAVIPKSSRDDHLKENFNIFDFSLSPEDQLKIDSIEKRYRFYPLNFLPGLTEHPQHPFPDGL